MSATPDRAKAIRVWLRAQAIPCTLEAVTAARAQNPDVVVGATPAAMADALGATIYKERLKVYWSVGMMFRAGILAREGSGHSMRYFVIREPKVARLSVEERRLRRNARGRKRNLMFRKEGTLTRAERNALRKQEAAERAAERAIRQSAQQAEREARFAASRKQREEAKAKAAAEKKARTYTPKPKPRTLQIVAKLERIQSVPVVTPTKPRLETVAEFLARGGKVERLPTSWDRPIDIAA